MHSLCAIAEPLVRDVANLLVGMESGALILPHHLAFFFQSAAFQTGGPGAGAGVTSAAVSPLTVFPVSVLAGFVGAMSGMGGGIILIPALTLLGLEIKQAIAISILSVIATSSGSASAYVRDHITNLKIGMFLEMFTIVGGLAGAALTLAASTRPLYIAFGFVLLGSWLTLLFAGHESWQGSAPQDRFSRWLELEGAYYDEAQQQTIHYRGRRAYFGGPLMFGAGVIAGLLGIGAGAVKVLILDLAMGLPPKVSTTTSNLIIGVTALAGASVYLVAGLINPGLAAPVILGVVLGAFLGTRLLVRLSNQSVRRFFLIILIVLAVEMIVRGVRGA
jgi:uncharacterized membrane protein YfcA